MKAPKIRLLALDVGERRIGLALAETSPAIAVPNGVINVDGSELKKIEDLIETEGVTEIIIGWPRNQSGQATQQTERVRLFAKKLENLGVKLHFQDESVTSVIAEERLKVSKKNYQKADIDAEAAAIILTDFLEANY